MTPQQSLDMITQDDTYGFLTNIEDNYETHRPLLWLALQLSKGSPVTELGSGTGSTPYLLKFCQDNSRPFWSFESNLDWAAKTGSMYVKDWNATQGIWQKRAGVLFIDHAPGEHRKVALEQMADRADIIVIHDTEQPTAGDYGFEPLWRLFKYVLHYNRSGGGAGATIVSNKVDLSVYKGRTFAGRVLE